MYGLTRKQIRTRFYISIPFSVIFLIAMIVMQFTIPVLEGLTWKWILISIVISVILWPVGLTGLFIDPKNVFVEPWKKAWNSIAKFPFWVAFIWIYPLFLALWFTVACFQMYIIGIKALIYCFQKD